MKALITKLVSSDAGIAALVLRVPVGLTLAAHGAQKLFAWFGGYGLDGTGQYMASLGLEPGFLMALLAGSAEFFGGLALALVNHPELEVVHQHVLVIVHQQLTGAGAQHWLQASQGQLRTNKFSQSYRRRCSYVVHAGM